MSIKEKTTDPGEALRDRGVLAWRKLAGEHPADVILATCDWWDSAGLGVGALVAAIRDGGMKAAQGGATDKESARTRHHRRLEQWSALLDDIDPGHATHAVLDAADYMLAEGVPVTVEAVEARLGTPLDLLADQEAATDDAPAPQWEPRWPGEPRPKQLRKMAPLGGAA